MCFHVLHIRLTNLSRLPVFNSCLQITTIEEWDGPPLIVLKPSSLLFQGVVMSLRVILDTFQPRNPPPSILATPVKNGHFCILWHDIQGFWLQRPFMGYSLIYFPFSMYILLVAFVPSWSHNITCYKVSVESACENNFKTQGDDVQLFI